MRKRCLSDISKESFEKIRSSLESVHKRTKPRTVDLSEVFYGRPVFVEKRLPVADVTERISQMANGVCLVREMSLSVEELRAKTQYQLTDHPSRLHRAFALKILNSF